MKKERHSRHNTPSTIKGLNNSANSFQSGRQISPEEKTEELFNKISSTPISICSTDCSLYKYKKGMCGAIGVKAPIGENCVAQEMSRHK